MSIYATLWKLKFPKEGDEYVGCDWIEVTAQGVPAHIGSPTPGLGYEEATRFQPFFPHLWQLTRTATLLSCVRWSSSPSTRSKGRIAMSGIRESTVGSGWRGVCAHHVRGLTRPAVRRTPGQPCSSRGRGPEPGWNTQDHPRRTDRQDGAEQRPYSVNRGGFTSRVTPSARTAEDDNTQRASRRPEQSNPRRYPGVSLKTKAVRRTRGRTQSPARNWPSP